MKTSRWTYLPVIVLAIVAAPRAAFACPVCFGQSDSPMALGTKVGVFFMLGVTASVLAGFAGFFIYLMRRAKLVADYEPRKSNPQEATA